MHKNLKHIKIHILNKYKVKWQILLEINIYLNNISIWFHLHTSCYSVIPFYPIFSLLASVRKIVAKPKNGILVKSYNNVRTHKHHILSNKQRKIINMIRVFSVHFWGLQDLAEFKMFPFISPPSNICLCFRRGSRWK